MGFSEFISDQKSWRNRANSVEKSIPEVDSYLQPSYVRICLGKRAPKNPATPQGQH